MSGQETRKLMRTPRHMCGTEVSLLRAIKPYPTQINFLGYNHKGQNITTLNCSVLTETRYNM